MASALIRFIRRPVGGSTLLSLVLALLVLVIPGMAQAAPTVVTVCGRDDAAGGVNLIQALSIGGQILIRCGPGQGIEITATRAIKDGTTIEGEGKAILNGTLVGALFTANGTVTLKGLRLQAGRNPQTAPFADAGRIVDAPGAALRLEGVHSEDARNTFRAASFVARDSKFVNMGDGTAGAAPGVTIDAETIELLRVEFSGGIDHPIGGGAAPAPGRKAFARTIVIADSLFANVRNSLLINDARVRIRNTRFLGNGTPLEAGSKFWGCCGGALTIVHSSIEVQGGLFEANRSSGFGGAILALGSVVRLREVTFKDNQARAGGAIFSWGRTPLVHSWGALSPSVPGLTLTRTRFFGNKASSLGGAILFAGLIEGQSVLLARNVAPRGGAVAAWRASGLAAPHDQVFAALDSASAPAPDILGLARPIFVDNQAGIGAAVFGGSADVRLGNALITRNGIFGGPSNGAILVGDRISIANSTVVQNWNPALAVPASAQIRLANSIVSHNRGGNCLMGGSISTIGQNLQYPGQSCGTAIRSQNPSLGADYVPGLLSAARGAGDSGTCLAEPMVRGVDLYGEARLRGGRCDLGAIERDLITTIAAGLPGDNDLDEKRRCLLLIMLIVFVLVLLLVVLLMWRRRRRSSKPAASESKAH